MQETIFSKIINKEIPANIVYEDEHTLAFLDIMPNNPGHTLVIPKKPSRNILDIDKDSFAKVMETVRLLAPKIKSAMKAEGVRISINNEPSAGQEVFHLHVHIIPMFADDHGKVPKKKTVSKEELAENQKLILAAS